MCTVGYRKGKFVLYIQKKNVSLGELLEKANNQFSTGNFELFVWIAQEKI